jgi:hypothetical protein
MSYETLMARDIHNAKPFATGKIQIGETELDGHPPFFFLFQTIGVDAGQGLY